MNIASKIIIGYVLAWITRWLVVGACIFIVSLFFIDNITVESPMLAIVFALLTSMAFSLGWLLNAIFANNFDDVNVIPNFIITPMIYLWGVFYSVSMLGEFWQTVSVFNPVLYMINGLRHAFLWVSDVDITTSFVIVILFIIALYILVLRLLQKGYKIKS